jgi:hypothetical protein
MLQGLAVGCLLTAAAAIAEKETSRDASFITTANGTPRFDRSRSIPAEGLPAKRPSKLRGSRKDESYASRMQSRIDEECYVTVGGQVNSPGRVTLGPSSTLQWVIEKAGGASPFGTLRRVRLTRGRHVNEYDLTTPEGCGIALQPKDTVEVPQKTVVGY